MSEDFLADLRAVIDVDDTTATRARYSSDAGIHRIPPRAVAFPRTSDQAIAAFDVARAHGVPLTPRGGGTSCASNAIGPGLVLDFSRYMNRVIAIDAEARTATVQPGCVGSTLQEAAAAYGLRFGPDPSSQNRATIAGMVANNACGPHATAWGRTSDNIVSLECVDGRGRRFTATTHHDASLPEVPGLAPLIDARLAPIRTQLGQFKRQVSGYSLEHLTPEGGRNLAATLAGTEGTLVLIVSVTVRLVPLPSAPVLMALGYPSMIEAADDVPALLPHNPLAVEGMDRRLIDVVRAHKGPGAVPPLPDGEGWLLVEVGAPGEKVEDSLQRAHTIAEAASTREVTIYPPGSQAQALWRIRADGAGLGGRTPPDGKGGGDQQAWPGFEDAAVPPQHLGAYLRDFTALMEEYAIDGLLYGHFGDGCVHVRLSMPLEDEAGVEHSRRFLHEAARIVASHGGSISGEHGDGRARGELLSHMYSPDMLELFSQVKAIFDPDNLLNPGVLASPQGAGRIDGVTDYLRRPAARPIPADGGFAFAHDGGDFTAAVHRCTGVGKCRAGVKATFMCPSYLATRDEKDVTRGRARILQEAANSSLISSISSPEVLEALDLCLACKACSADCPAGVDMARYRSEVFYRRYRGKVRPLSHYALGRLPRWTRLSARIPGAATVGNAVMGIDWLRRLIFRTIGLDARRGMPPLQQGTFSRWARSRGVDAPSPEALAHPEAKRAGAGAGSSAGTGAGSSAGAGGGSLPGAASSPTDASGRPYVLVWADSFSQTLDDTGARALVEVVERNGFAPIVASDVCCGLTWITTGQLGGARSHLRKLLDALAPFAAAGIPIVGVEPSCTAVLRDDLLELLPDDPRSSLVSRATHTLAELLEKVPVSQRILPSLEGLTLVAQPHCHHYSVMGWERDHALLESLGAKVVRLEGCCGLAGNFGMEKGHYDLSVAVASHSLLPTLEANPDAVYLADGFSCRTQAVQLAQREGVHLATLLAGDAR